jgi:hypothetical protein
MPSTSIERGQLVVLAVVLAVVAETVWVAAGPTVRYHLRPDSDPAAVAAADQAVTAVNDTDAYRVRIVGRATATRGDRRARATLDGRALVNASARRMHVRLSADTDDPFGSDTQVLHLDGYTVYRPCPYSGYVTVANASYAVDVPRNRSWRSSAFLGGLDAVFDAAKLYDEGVETVDGERAREIRLVVNPRRASDLGSRTAPLTEGDAEGVGGEGQVAPLTAPEASDIRLWVSTETGRPLRFRVAIDRSRVGGADVSARFTYDIAYGPTPVAMPNRTVPTEDACPAP